MGKVCILDLFPHLSWSFLHVHTSSTSLFLKPAVPLHRASVFQMSSPCLICSLFWDSFLTWAESDVRKWPAHSRQGRWATDCPQWKGTSQQWLFVGDQVQGRASASWEVQQVCCRGIHARLASQWGLLSQVLVFKSKAAFLPGSPSKERGTWRAGEVCGEGRDVHSWFVFLHHAGPGCRWIPFEEICFPSSPSVFPLLHLVGKILSLAWHNSIFYFFHTLHD